MRLHKEFGFNPTMPICFICGKEKSEIVLLGAAYKGEAPSRMVLDREPCEECKRLMDLGVILISTSDGEEDQPSPARSGGFCVVKDEFVERAIEPEVARRMLEARVCFVPDAAWDALGLPRGPVEGIPSTVEDAESAREETP